MAQVGDGELADRRRGRRVARRGELAVVGAHGLAGQEVGGDVGDVVAVVGRSRASRGRRASSRRGRALTECCAQRRDLHAGVVVIELARAPRQPCVSSRLQMASPSAAWRAWPTCSGPVGLAETNSTITGSPSWPAAVPNAGAGREHLGDDGLLGGRARRRRLMKPGPATSIDSTQRSTAGLARAARRSARPRPRAALRRCALASGIAAVTARSPWAAWLAASRTRRASAVSGLTSAIAARSASSSSSRAEIIGRILRGGASRAAAQSARSRPDSRE